jgi:hypothetical protein
MANAQQTRPHPEMANGVAWMPVAMQPAPAPATKPDPVMFWGYVCLGLSCLFAGILISQAHQNHQLQQANQRADRAIQALEQAQQAKAAYCQGVTK